MHKIQSELLGIAKQKNLGKYTLREIGAFVGEKSPQKIKHHLNQLEKKGFLTINKMDHIITTTDTKTTVNDVLKNANLLSIPILGAANAGPAMTYADPSAIEGFLRVSSSLIAPSRLNHRLFALKVDGPSMNMAIVNGKKIENGDYVIIDSEDREAMTDDIVLSIINGMANIKKYYVDKENNQILLMSESTYDFPAIHIHEDDDFMVNGKVVGVIKTPKQGKSKK